MSMKYAVRFAVFAIIKQKKILVPLCLFILNMVDYFATYYLINKHDVQEANPIMDWFFINLGDFAIIPKTLLAVVSCLLIYKLFNTKYIRILAYIISILYFMVCLNHLFIFLYIS